MTENVFWMLEVAINEGQLDDFKALMEEMVTATQADEPGALNYEWFINAEGSECHIYERYADNGATMVHLGNFGSKFAGRFMTCATPKRFMLYGPADEQVLGALGPMGAVHHTQIGGFAR